MGLAVSFMFSTTAAAAEPSTLYLIFLDMKQSVPESEYQANLAALTKGLSQLGTGRVMIYELSDNTFSDPKLLIEQEIPPPDPDDSFFQTKVRQARYALLKGWEIKVSQLKRSYTRSDVLGAISLAGHLGKAWQGPKVLILFSDMRHSAQQIDFENTPIVEMSVLEKAKGLGLLPNLGGFQVWVLGVSTYNKSPLYLESLERFWRAYFYGAGASLKLFVPQRPFPKF